MGIFIQQIVNGLVLGSIYALIALGYTMVYGILGIINFVHGDVLMIDTMSTLTAISLLQKYFPNLPDWLTLMFTLLFAMPVYAIVVYTVEHVAYRPLRNAPRLAPLIATIDASIMLQILAMMIWLRNPLTFPQLLPSNPIGTGSMGATITGREIVIILVSILVMVKLILLVNCTKLGRAMCATTENQCVADLIGVDPNLVISATFMIDAVMVAVADVTMVTNYGDTHFYMGFIPSLKAFTAAMPGGIDNLVGAIVGDVPLGLIEALGADYIDDLTSGMLGSNYQGAFVFIVLIGVLLFRPSGIMGERVVGRA